MNVHGGAVLCCVTLGCGSVPARPHADSRVTTALIARARDLPRVQAIEQARTEVAEDGEPPAASLDTEVAAVGRDPLAVEDGFDDENGPTIEVTPAARLRRRTSAQLDDALRFAPPVASGDAAARQLIHRLGEPTWTEAPKNSPRTKRRVWVASVTEHQCHRLVLEPSGELVIESASTAEWRMLTALTDQNPCTGETKRSFLR